MFIFRIGFDSKNITGLGFMEKLKLDKDEVILLEDRCVNYKGSLTDAKRIDELTLTNKRLIAFYSIKREDYSFEISLEDIKRHNGDVMADYHKDFNIGDCLRIQTYDGIECFGLNGVDSIKEDFRELFSSKSSAYRVITKWIETIKDACNGRGFNEYREPVKAPRKETATLKEFITCSKCGKEFSKESLFCPYCGTPVNKVEPQVVPPVPEVPTKKVEKKEPEKNKIQKCPVCGDIIPSDAIRCPSCGYEVTGREAVSSVKDFFDTVSSIKGEDKKIEAIKMYAIPNNKEDILEFMLLAVSNFDAKLYATNNQGENLSTAWYTKIEQCYKKGMLLFDKPSDIEKIEKLYKETQIKTKSIKHTRLILIISGIATIIVSILLIVLGTKTGENGDSEVGIASYIGMAILAIGIIVLVFGLKKKKTNAQLEQERIEKMNKKKK